MSLTGSLGAFCFAGYQKAVVYGAFPCLFSFPGGILLAPTAGAQNIVYFLDLPYKAVCVRCNIPRSICSSRVEGPKCVNATPYLALAYRQVYLLSSKADAFLFFLGCLEPPGVIEWRRFGARPAG